MKKYKDLSREELHKMFGRDISKYVFDWGEEQSEREKKCASIIEKELKIKLKHFPRVNLPKKVKTPDFASANKMISVEIKSPTSYSGIDRSVNKAKKQMKKIKGTHIVVIDTDSIREDLANIWLIEKVVEESNFYQINYFIIIKDDKILYKRLPKK